VATSSCTLNVRLPEDMLRRVERVRERLARQVPGATRTDAVRMLIAKALDLFEAEGCQLSHEDRDWLGHDLSRLGEFEPYDFEARDPESLGQPVRRMPDGSFVVEARR